MSLTTIHNISLIVLNDTKRTILGKGIGFVPTPRSVSEVVIDDAFSKFAKSMQIRWHFRHNSGPFSGRRVPNPSWDVPLDLLKRQLKGYLSVCDDRLQAEMITHTNH